MISPTNYFKHLSKNRICLGFIVFYIYQLISVLFSQDITSGTAILVSRLPLLVLPLAFCFIDFKKKTWDKILLFYAIITTVASIIGFSFGIYKAIVENDSGFLYNDNISIFLSKQAVYFAFYVSIAILIFVIQLRQYPPIVQKYRFLIYLSVVWLLFIIFMLASRTAMFGVLVILFLYVFTSLIRKKRYMEGMLILLSILIGSVIVSKLFPKTLNRFKGTTETNFQFDNKNVENHFNAEYDESKWNGTNTRVAIWKCAIEVWGEQPLFGTDLGDRNKALMDKYKKKHFEYAINTQKNTHNQYLDILVSMGVVGLLVFIIVFFIFMNIF